MAGDPSETRPDDGGAPEPGGGRPRVPWLLDAAAAYSWRLILVGIVVWGVLTVMGRLLIVMLPAVVGVLLTRALMPVATRLRAHRWRRGFAAAGAMAAMGLALGGLTAAVVPSLAGEFSSLRPTLTRAFDDLEDWLVEDSPFGVSRADVDRLRDRAGSRLDAALRTSDGAILDGATLAAEVLAGVILALVLTFFFLRDGDRLVAKAVGLLRPERRAPAERALRASWDALGGYLRGATLLGLVEAAVIGLTLAVSGGGLVAPVMLVTFLAAFVPIVGAILAGALAVLVALVTGGLASAVAVLIVAIVVQQLDNDVLAPVIYGRSLRLNPAMILVSVAAGGALFGLVGTVLAVPVVAVAFNAVTAARTPAARPTSP